MIIKIPSLKFSKGIFYLRLLATTAIFASARFIAASWTGFEHMFEIMSRLGLEPRTLCLKGRCSTS